MGKNLSKLTVRLRDDAGRDIDEELHLCARSVVCFSGDNGLSICIWADPRGGVMIQGEDLKIVPLTPHHIRVDVL